MKHEFTLAELDSESAVELAPRNLLRHSSFTNNGSITLTSNSGAAVAKSINGGGDATAVNIQVNGGVTVTLS